MAVAQSSYLPYWLLPAVASVLVVGAWFIHPVVCLLTFGLCVHAYFEEQHRQKKFHALRSSRGGEGICEFARSFNRHATDPWVIRAVYDELQEYVDPQLRSFPIRSTDELFGDLTIDHEDFEFDLITSIAKRCGRTLSGHQVNERLAQLRTASDLVLFLNAQPTV